MNGPDFVMILVLIAAVATIAYYAGWKAARSGAQSTLAAALTVSEIAKAAGDDAARFRAALDTTGATVASCTSALEANTRTIDERYRAVAEALETLFNGFERAGFVRSARASTRQVGEPETEAR